MSTINWSASNVVLLNTRVNLVLWTCMCNEVALTNIGYGHLYLFFPFFLKKKFTSKDLHRVGFFFFKLSRSTIEKKN